MKKAESDFLALAKAVDIFRDTRRVTAAIRSAENDPGEYDETLMGVLWLKAKVGSWNK